MRSHHLRRGLCEAGFSLIELMAALTILGLITVVTSQITQHAADTASQAERARELRYLAEYKYEEVKTFEEFYDDILDGNFEDLENERFRDFRWTLDIRDVVVFGASNVEEAEYYFEDPDDNDDEDTTVTAPPANGANATPEELRELTLRVTAPEDAGPADYIEIVFLLPKVQ
jgi:prepilin-type N-terminal cleavage/methylation domain-containing protein